MAALQTHPVHRATPYSNRYPQLPQARDKRYNEIYKAVFSHYLPEHTAPHIHMTESLHLHTSLHACLVNHQSTLFFNGQYKYNTYLSLQHLCIIIYTSAYIMYVKKPGKYFKFSSLSLIIIDRSIITETPCHGTMHTLSPEAPSWKHC